MRKRERYAEPPRIFVCRPTLRAGIRLREGDSGDAGAPCVPAPVTRRKSGLLKFYNDGPPSMGFTRDRNALGVSWRPEFLFRIESESERRDAGAPYAVSDSGARVAPLVLPLERIPTTSC